MGIGIKPEMIAAYKRLHASGMPLVLAQIARVPYPHLPIICSIRKPLFIHFEYHVHDFAADMADRPADPTPNVWAACHALPALLPSRQAWSIGPRWKRFSLRLVKENDRIPVI